MLLSLLPPLRRNNEISVSHLSGTGQFFLGGCPKNKPPSLEITFFLRAGRTMPHTVIQIQPNIPSINNSINVITAILKVIVLAIVIDSNNSITNSK